MPIAPPTPGAVENGYVYMGGDPGDQKSWRPLPSYGGETADYQDKLRRLDIAQGMVKKMPNRTTGILGSILAPIPTTTSHNMRAQLEPVISGNTIGTIMDAKSQGGSLGSNPSNKDAEIYAKAVANLTDQGVAPQQYLDEINTARSVLSRRLPGISQDLPLDLSQGQPRAQVPKGLFYRDPQGNIRRNDNGDAGNPIVKAAQIQALINSTKKPAAAGGLTPAEQAELAQLRKKYGR